MYAFPKKCWEDISVGRHHPYLGVSVVPATAKVTWYPQTAAWSGQDFEQDQK